MTALIILLTLNIFILIYGQLKNKGYVGKEIAIYKQQAEMYRLQSEERESLWLESRRLYHDFKYHLACLKGYSDKRQYKAMDEYIHALIDVHMTAYWENKSGNIVVDSLIGYKMNLARDLNISLITDFDVSGNLPFEDLDLSIIVGNAFENAIEAVGKLSPQERIINLSLKMQQNILTLKLTNPYAGEIRKDAAGNLLTSKKDGTFHGIGLGSIEKKVHKYNGQMKIISGHNLFQLLIIMYGKSNVTKIPYR